MAYFNAVLNQVIIFLLIGVTGFIVVKIKAVPQSVLPSISILFAKVIIPALVFINTVNGATREDMVSSIFILGIIAIVFVLLIVVMKLLSKGLRMKGDRAKIYPILFAHGSVGFVGIPLLLSIFGQRAMIVVTIYAIMDMVTLWTYSYTQTFPATNKLKFTPKTLLKMINPTLVAVVLAIVFIFLEVRIPIIINSALESVANAGMALPFIYIGGSLASMANSDLLKRAEIYIGIFVKMLLLPIAVYLAMTALGIAHDLSLITAILFGLPSMPLVAMLAGINGSDEQYSTTVVLVTNVACLFTLTFITYVITVVL